MVNDNVEGKFSRPLWFLAYRATTLMVIHIWGPRTSTQEMINHEGQTLRFYPSLRCYIFEREIHGHDTPSQVERVWIEHLGYHSLFLGLNHPLIGHVDNGVLYGPHPQHLPFGRSGCVYIMRDRVGLARDTLADWIRLRVSNLSPPEPAIGGAFDFEHDLWGIRQTPMWIVPRLLGSRLP